MTRPRILLADDHRIVAEGLKAILAEEFDLVAVVEDGEALVEAARRLRPEVVVADIGMPRLNGFEALAELRKDDSGVRFVFLTMHPEAAYARRAREAGARGYVLKHSAPDELVSAIRAVLEGGTHFAVSVPGGAPDGAPEATGGRGATGGRVTPRQREILQLLADGCSAKEVARRLEISPRTVEFHKRQMMESVGVHSTAQLINWAVKEGVVVI